MTYDTGIGILGGQFLEKGEHGSLLGLGSGIGRMAGDIETAFVANTE